MGQSQYKLPPCFRVVWLPCVGAVQAPPAQALEYTTDPLNYKKVRQGGWMWTERAVQVARRAIGLRLEALSG